VMPHPVKHLQAAGMNRDRARCIGGSAESVDDADVDAAASELGCGDEADGPGTDDNDIE